MKRLLTIFLSSAVCIGLWGQAQPKLPMTIIGDVYVESGGKMRSDGLVHLRALPGGKFAKVANHGNLKMDSIAFYTNASTDGLLMNQNVASGSVESSYVSVRKDFYADMTWFMVSFPFDVDMDNDIHDPLSGRKLVRDVDFQVQFYNAQKRANTGKHVRENWEDIPTTGSQIMEKGKAYFVIVSHAKLDPSLSKSSYDVEFRANTPQNINDVFLNIEKGVNLTFASSGGVFTTNFSEGWNAIGGLNSTQIKMKADVSPLNRTIEHDRTIYYWNGGLDWEEFNPLDPSTQGTLRPYGVIFVKTDEDLETRDLLNFNLIRGRATGEYGGFAYFSNGLTLDIDDHTYVFRSSNAPQSASYDLVKLQLADVDNSFKSSQTYFKFGDQYSKSFKSSEDDIMFFDNTTANPSKERSLVWSLVKENSKNVDNYVFLNAIPYGNHEIPLGVNIPATGDYVFSLQELLTNKSVESAILWDKVANRKTELLTKDYYFQANSTGKITDRFVLYFSNKTVTSTDLLSDVLEIYAYTDNDVLIVKNLLPGDKVQAYDITGRIIASGMASNDTFTTYLKQKGVYFVNARGKTIKVLNK